MEIRVIDASPVEARLEFRYTGGCSAHAQLVGTITGPRLEASRTLPATVPLRSLPGSDLPAAEAVIPDPCFFTPELHFLYDVSIELRRGDEIVDSAEFSLALHPQGVEKQ